MAANTKGAKGIASFGKRVVDQIWTRDRTHYSSTPFVASSFTLRRAAHASAYDKNLDDQVRPTIVPDDVIEAPSDKYWGPHPQTGVFGPAAEQSLPADGERGFHSSPANGGDNSVLEEKAWFRPTSLEDLEKPHHP